MQIKLAKRAITIITERKMRLFKSKLDLFEQFASIFKLFVKSLIRLDEAKFVNSRWNKITMSSENMKLLAEIKIAMVDAVIE